MPYSYIARDYDLGNEPDSGRSMLPGFQPKVLLARFGDHWAYPENRAHSTHILKPPPPHRPATIFDEYYSHELSRHMGLTSFQSELVTYNQVTFLAIERYDRIVEGETVRPIHQEDAAQALGLDWTDSGRQVPESRAAPLAAKTHGQKDRGTLWILRRRDRPGGLVAALDLQRDHRQP